MRTSFDSIARQIGELGQRCFSLWSPELYEQFLEGPATRLRERLTSGLRPEEVFRTYLRLGIEALAHGYVPARSLASRSSSTETEESTVVPEHRRFLDVCWTDLLPVHLGDLVEDRQTRAMVRLWNLGEGLLDAPLWMDLVATAELVRNPELEGAARLVDGTLARAVSGNSPSTWTGPCQMTSLNMDHVQPGFLPGDMHLATPRLLCVHHRLDASRHAAILLRGHGHSLLVGRGACLGSALNGPVESPPVSFREDRVELAGHKLLLPGLEAVYKHAFSPAGYLAVNDVALSRVWILECP